MREENIFLNVHTMAESDLFAFVHHMRGNTEPGGFTNGLGPRMGMGNIRAGLLSFADWPHISFSLPIYNIAAIGMQDLP